MKKVKYNVIVKSTRVQYKLIIDREITIILGDSGTGNTHLLETINTPKSYGSKNTVKSMLPLVPILYSRNWVCDLEEITDSIVFLVEEFARIIKNSNNYPRYFT